MCMLFAATYPERTSALVLWGAMARSTEAEDYSLAPPKEALIEEMNQALEKLPGIEPSFSQPIRDNVLESISQIDGQIVVKVFGDDLDVLRSTAAKVLAAISDVKGVSRAMIDRQGELPQTLIEIDRAVAARYGLNVADIEDQWTRSRVRAEWST